MRIYYKLILTLSIFIGLGIFRAEPANAQWPPFNYTLIPTYADGKITYSFRFAPKVDWQMTNIAIKIPLPANTRFVEAKTIPSIESKFDGLEVTFFIPVLYERIRTGDATFVVEIINPSTTVITTHSWIAWEGNLPGDYLTKDVSIDTTQTPIAWEGPPGSRLQLTLEATVADNLITYTIYPRNRGSLRMWDLRINFALPEAATFLSAEAPPSFTSNFDSREVSFFTSELVQRADTDSLKVKVVAADTLASTLKAHAWATWKNVGKNVGIVIPAQEEIQKKEIIVQPYTTQWVVADERGDVPFLYYDLLNVALEDEGNGLKIIFYMVEALPAVGTPLNFILNMDVDCQADTGNSRGNYKGAEYTVDYDHEQGRAQLSVWNETQKKLERIGLVAVNNSAGSKTVVMLVPYNLLANTTHFCWTAWGKNFALDSELPHDTMSGSLAFTPRQPTETVVPTASSARGDLIREGDIWRYIPGWSEPPVTWTAIDFDDSNWLSGPTSIGYGPGKHTTDLSLAVPLIPVEGAPVLVQRPITASGVTLAVLPSGETRAVFMRRTFTITDSASLSKLNLKINYEGGFVAYLNGVEVVRRNLGQPGSPVFYDLLATDQTGSTSEVIGLTDYLSHLVEGVNILAVQGHRSVNSTGLTITPQLSWEFDPLDIPLNSLPSDNLATVIPTELAPPVRVSNLSGKLAVPIDNNQTTYDVYIFTLPQGQEIIRIPYARQPNFRWDGQRLLINREGGGTENVYEYNPLDGMEKQISDAPRDAHPFYDMYGNRVVYGNAELTYGRPEPVYKENRWYYTGVHKPFIFVQCGLMPPHEEKEPRCRDIPNLGVLVPAGQMGEIQGTHPVWTSNDMIAYKGCNTWAGSRLCGIYSVPSASTKGFSDGFIPRQLTLDTSDTPSDSKGNLIAFTSLRDGNWEAYVMDLNGDGVRNLSNSPNSDDGLPTLSPDGYWVAFVSNRGGQWAIWAAPAVGGEVQKLFDLPTNAPWGTGDREWINERISWGP